MGTRRSRWAGLVLLAMAGSLAGCASAETQAGSPDPVLLPHRYSESVPVVQDRIIAWIRSEENWLLEDEERTRGVIWAVRFSDLLRFQDRVKIQLSEGAEGTTVSASSESTWGFYDFGQNRRNLQHMWEALDKRLTRVWPIGGATVTQTE